MYIRYAFGFLLASLVQAGIVFLTEAMGISALNPEATALQLILHLFTGQAAGFLLWYVVSRVEPLGRADAWTVGLIYGIALWGVILPINSLRGVVQPPWAVGPATVLASLLAFAAYGVIAALTVKGYARVGLK